MIALELHSPQPPQVVLAALRARAGEWRESQIPRELWSVGISAIECDVRGTTCALHYEHRYRGAGTAGHMLRALATVSPDGGGTRVQVVVKYQLRYMALYVIGSVFATSIGVIVRGPVGLSYLALPLGVIGIYYVYLWAATRSCSRRGDPEADYLVRRIEAAVAGARSTPASAQAS